jgi:molybdopterin-dependent oxidoreductase-like protein protein
MTEGSKKHYIGNTAQYSSAGLIIRPKEPKNLKAPFDRIDSYPTPTELFYIRSHFPTPHLDRTYYQSRIDGAVRRPFALSYEELRGMRSETRVAILECAGNSRVFLVPQVQGAQWELGAAGNAEWTGVLHEGRPDRPRDSNAANSVSPLWRTRRNAFGDI